jgi:transposase
VPRERLSVRKITDVLRLKEAGLSGRGIAESLACARSTVGDILSRAQAAGLGYEEALALGDAEIYARLYPGNTGSPRRRAEPDYDYLHRELRRSGVTRQQLWKLCRARHNFHYADVRIMPTSDRKAWSVAVPALLRSA